MVWLLYCALALFFLPVAVGKQCVYKTYAVINVYGVSDCQDGGWLFRNRCYWFIGGRRTWQDANLYCSRLGTDLQLVTIPDTETNDFLVEKLSTEHTSIDCVWIGLRDFASDIDWRWVDGSPLNYTKWRDEESLYTTAGHHCGCLRMYNMVKDLTNRGYWDHKSCYRDSKAFVCSETYKPAICPNGGTFFRDRCFWLGSKGTLPMREADKACQEEFGENVRLPVIRDAEMNAFLSKQLYTSWLGLDDVQTEGEFKWIDGTPLTFTKWYTDAGEPNNRNIEDCVILSFGYNNHWFDVSCADENRYVCAVPTCYSELDTLTDNHCSISCASCVADGVCFHNGECKCVPEFDGMTCDKGNFSMSVHAPKTVVAGESVDLLCKTNLPVREVEFEWIKISNGKKNTVLATVLPKQGACKLSIANVTSSDEAGYICIVTYMIGEISELQMRGTNLKISTKADTDSSALQQTPASSITGLVIALAVLTIACVVVLVGFIIIVFRIRSSKASQQDVKMSQVLME